MTSPPEAVRAYFDYINQPNFPPRYNIAPTQPTPIVRINGKGEREFSLVRWGLMPGWVKDPKDFRTLINARSETVLDKPSFRAAIRYRRCLVPADAYYEWTGAKGQKRPHLIRQLDGDVMAFAGIWEQWMGPDGEEMETMAILTKPANGIAKHIHHRMPVILVPKQFEIWLDHSSGRAEEAMAAIPEKPDNPLESIEISTKLNNPRNESADVQQPIPVQQQLV